MAALVAIPPIHNVCSFEIVPQVWQERKRYTRVCVQDELFHQAQFQHQTIAGVGALLEVDP
jgi:hypothetical protein